MQTIQEILDLQPDWDKVKSSIIKHIKESKSHPQGFIDTKSLAIELQKTSGLFFENKHSLELIPYIIDIQSHFSDVKWFHFLVGATPREPKLLQEELELSVHLATNGQEIESAILLKGRLCPLIETFELKNTDRYIYLPVNKKGNNNGI